jgi:hypothetical protein
MMFRGNHLDTTDVNVGFDIEFALLNTKGNLVSAIPYLRGTKGRPQDCPGGNIQRDNVAFEIAVNYSTRCTELIDNIRSVLQYGTNILPKRYRLSCVPSGVYSDKELKHAEAQEFGCDADYDAKTGTVNKFGDGIVDPNLRSFGLHIHTGPMNRSVDPRVHTLASDLCIGLFFAMKDNSAAAHMRRNLYGKPSCYRVKLYGVEYRTLSNYCCKSPRLIKMVYMLNHVAYFMSRYAPNLLFEKVDVQEVSDVIMSGDTALASMMFYEHVQRHLDLNLQRMVIDELDYDGYGSLQEEWMLTTTNQNKTTHQALRTDYHQQPDIIKEMKL